MKKIFSLLLLFVCSVAIAQIKLDFPFANGMVLQRNQPVTLSGKAAAGEAIKIVYFKKKYTTQASQDGKWSITLPAGKVGGPYLIQINEQQLSDIWFGDVWLCSGQSNMELPVRRVMDKYADEIETNSNDKIRLLRMERNTPFEGPVTLGETAKWVALNKANAYEFSAIGYFMAQEMFARTGVPQGVIQSAQGGTPIQAWMGKEWLEGYPMYLSELALNSDATYRQKVSTQEGVASARWQQVLNQQEKALNQDWTAMNYDDSEWQQVDAVKGEWAINEHGNILGVHWFRKEITLTAEQAAKDATLRLGILTDADDAWVNGVKVGNTGYQYPPRIYNIPIGTLKAGRNVIAVRLQAQGQRGEFVDDKYRGIIFNTPWLCQKQEDYPLDNQWKHHVAVQMPPSPGQTFFHYTPSVLYNGMIAPLAAIKLAGAVWYQGESNVGRPLEYKDLMKRLIACWRTLFNQPQLPVVAVEMADYERPVTRNWQIVQQAQREAAQEDEFAECASAKDLGEWNDIHPLAKKEVAIRVVDAMMKIINK